MHWIPNGKPVSPEFLASVGIGPLKLKLTFYCINTTEINQGDKFTMELADLELRMPSGNL